VTKLNALKVPPLPPNLGVVNDIDHLTCTHGRDAGSDSGAHEWRPRTDTLIASSSFTNGHIGPVSRLAVAPDDRYFVSGSYDGTVRVWESRQANDSDGILVSSVTYSGHSDGCEQRRPRINDVATLENTNSVASGASDGSLHVWRVDMVNTSDRSRVAGSSTIRKIDPEEGEIHAVSHFSTPSASIVTFATQGIVHSMDLRQPQEPFKLIHRPDIGYLTSMALGGDRHWMITGTSRGFVSLWDIRFQQMIKLWQHPSAFPVTRLTTSFTALPKKWGGWSASDTDRQPVMFVACGQNECGMFDALSGSCRQSFRVIGPRAMSLESSTDSDVNAAKISSLREVDLSSSRKLFRLDDFSMTHPHKGAQGPSINALVGNVGGLDLSGLITGGDDGYIRYWDFSNAAKCFSVSGHPGVHHRPTYERVDVDGQRLMLCRQAPAPRHNEIESSRIPRMVERGPSRTENRHQDSVQDVKILNFPEKLLVSCSRDSTVKLWR
jgi:phosphoinositide-3-kinase regulatory subunit 4